MATINDDDDDNDDARFHASGRNVSEVFARLRYYET